MDGEKKSRLKLGIDFIVKLPTKQHFIQLCIIFCCFCTFGILLIGITFNREWKIHNKIFMSNFTRFWSFDELILILICIDKPFYFIDMLLTLDISSGFSSSSSFSFCNKPVFCCIQFIHKNSMLIVDCKTFS